MADAFSSSSETVIQRVVDVSLKENTPAEKLTELYQITRTCAFISEHHFGKVALKKPYVVLNSGWKVDNCGSCVGFCFCSPQVALQFPDELLVDSAAVAAEIERNSRAKTFILGDTSYGRYYDLFNFSSISQLFLGIFFFFANKITDFVGLF